MDDSEQEATRPLSLPLHTETSSWAKLTIPANVTFAGQTLISGYVRSMTRATVCLLLSPIHVVTSITLTD